MKGKSARNQDEEEEAADVNPVKNTRKLQQRKTQEAKDIFLPIIFIVTFVPLIICTSLTFNPFYFYFRHVSNHTKKAHKAGNSQLKL